MDYNKKPVAVPIYVRTAVAAMMLAVCLLVISPGCPDRVSAVTINATVSAAKKNGKRINFNSRLPLKYWWPYHVLQGTGTDGKYVYLNYWKKNSTKCVMMKLNAKTLKKVKVSKPLNIHHGNDIAYNPNTGLLYVVYSDKDPFQITMVNPKTLTICGRRNVMLPQTLEGATDEELKAVMGLVGITYNKTRNQYAMRVSGLCDYIVFDANFNALRYVHAKAPKANLRRQSLDSDDNYVYLVLDKAGYYNLIMVYDWYGNYKYRIKIPLSFEMEGMYHYRNKLYGAFYNKYGPSGYIYRLNMP